MYNFSWRLRWEFPRFPRAITETNSLTRLKHYLVPLLSHSYMFLAHAASFHLWLWYIIHREKYLIAQGSASAKGGLQWLFGGGKKKRWSCLLTSVAICPPPVSGPIAGVMVSPDGRETNRGLRVVGLRYVSRGRVCWLEWRLWSAASSPLFYSGFLFAPYGAFYYGNSL